ncbi:Serine-threonine/tyrosine-protein kinase [Hirschfeldia incana]|nr:Serine-threonine/tyrosine-protein kinase [Hirschfeldia incana]
MFNLFQSPKRSLANAIIWNLFMILDCVLSANERHKHCSPSFSCGHKIHLNYPFWTSDREECGHPDFKVNCSDGFAELTISSVKLRILETNSKSRIIRLARMDYIDDLCPHKPENATINLQVLPFSEDTEFLTFYYRCHLDSEVKSTFTGHIRQLHCGDDIDGQSFSVSSHVHFWNKETIDEFRESCGSIVNVPVSRSALKLEERNQSADAITKTLEKGFELSFNRDCLRCKESNGACGYDHKLGGFVCYCTNKSRHKHTCENGLSKREKIGIGFACGFLGATLLAAFLFFFYIRRRTKLAAEYTNKGLFSATPYSSDNEVSTTLSSTSISRSNATLMPSISNLANRSVNYGVQVFSYEELEEATDNFSRELGDGGFSTVYYGLLKDGRAVAVKRFFEKSLKRVEQFKNEIDILKSLKHPNLVILYGCTTRHSRELLLVYEYISNGTLADNLHGDQAQSRPISWSGRLNIAIQTASALSFLHASVDMTRHREDINLANMAISKIGNDSVHELVDLSLGFERDPSVNKMMVSVAELAFRCLKQEREARPSMDEVVKVLREIQKEGERDAPEVVEEVHVRSGDEVALLKQGVTRLLSPVAEKETSSSNTTPSSSNTTTKSSF